MKLETFKQPTTEIFVTHNDTSVTVTPWSNCEGLNVIMQGKDGGVKLAAVLNWDELDTLLVALQAGRTT